MMNFPLRYWRLKARALSLMSRKKEMTSLAIREAYSKGYDINVGLYSYGCFDRNRFTPHIDIGRYCSMSILSRRVNANHAMDYLSLHPYFYNAKLGFVDEEKIVRSRCVIEDDVWISHGVIILPSVTFIGRGSVLAAGSVVTKNVERYSIVTGVPGKAVRKRFDDETIAKIEGSQWWKLSASELERFAKGSWDVVVDPEKLTGEKLSV